MNTITTVLIALIIIVALLLVLIIMVQNPKGGGISATFGGGGASMGGVQNTNTFLDKSTWTLAIVMVALILLTNFTFSNPNKTRATDSNLKGVVEDRIIDEEAAPVETPADAPAESTGEEAK